MVQETAALNETIFSDLVTSNQGRKKEKKNQTHFKQVDITMQTQA